MTKIVATSDWHGELPDIEPCDLLLIGGDVCPVRGSHTPHVQRGWLRDHFYPHLAASKADQIIWIAGNHDFVCERPGFPRAAKLAMKDAGLEGRARYLCDDICIPIKGGPVIYGNPYVANLRNWAFYKSDPDLQEMKIPSADIYLLHSPVAGILEDGHPEWATPWAARIYKHHPAAVICGHIHEGYGTDAVGDPEVKFYNVAHMDGAYNPVNPPIVFEI